MAKSLDYLLHGGQAQTKSIRETLTLSDKVQNRVPFVIQTPRSLEMTGSYPNPRLNSLHLKDYIHNQFFISLR